MISSQQHQHEGQKGSILVIDDGDASLNVLFTILKEDGYSVCEKPLDLWSQSPSLQNTLPDLVLVDVRKSSMDGYRVCAILKSNPNTRAIPVIFISSIDRSMNHAKAMVSGAVDYVTDPFDAQEVLWRIETHISLRRLREMLSSAAGNHDPQPVAPNEHLQRAFQEIYVLTRVTGCKHAEERVRQAARELKKAATESKLAEEALNQARSELAHVARITTLNALTASIAHEVNQPLSGIITNASTCLRMLDGDPPNVDGARETARRTIRDGKRASDVIMRLRALFSKKEFTLEPLDLNEATREVIALLLADLQRNRVSLRSELAGDLPPVTGDRVQLQQVILNLILNASDAMAGVDDRPRELLIKTDRDDGDRVCLSVKDAGAGFAPGAADRLFEAFYTTKNHGMGIGLSISRSIIEAHHGRLWVAANDGPGVTFLFAIPCKHEGLKDPETHVKRMTGVTDAA